LIGRLGEGHDPTLPKTGEAFDAEVALIAPDALTEVAHGHEAHHLDKYERSPTSTLLLCETARTHMNKRWDDLFGEVPRQRIK
jgi:hypothetical protein